MLVPAPPKVDARQMSGFTVKHDRTSLWKTISAKTNFTCTNHAPIVCVALLVENNCRRGVGLLPWPDGSQMVVALNAGTRVPNTKNRNAKGKLGARPCLSLFRENSQWPDDSLRGTVRKGANWSSLPEGKAGADRKQTDHLFEGGSSRSHYVESSIWKRLWTCRTTDC